MISELISSLAMQKIIDTHIHVWNFDKAAYAWLDGNTSILNRTYHIEEIETERNAAGITEGVLVQAANNIEDTSWMLEVAANTDWIKGVVGWLPLMDTTATEWALEEKYSKEKYFKGVRHLIHDEADPGWLLQPAVIDSLKILAAKNITYDVVGVLPQHIETVLKVAEQIPDLKMVFDHLNQPPMKTNEKFGAWGDLMKIASQHKNFHAKISGLGTATADPGNWGVEDIKPYVSFVLEHFGADRCFCGGDWPVSLLASSYTKTWTTYRSVVTELLNEDDSEKVFYNNAQQFYNL
jgi:L-fuconolactonase